jgi:hypothetical protein
MSEEHWITKHNKYTADQIGKHIFGLYAESERRLRLLNKYKKLAVDRMKIIRKSQKEDKAVGFYEGKKMLKSIEARMREIIEEEHPDINTRNILDAKEKADWSWIYTRGYYSGLQQATVDIKEVLDPDNEIEDWSKI